ncbi:hypothetical protein, partial [Bacillus sp. WP8]|uniref:hypothetical protein n=1 Tax=Bacillus sp. WP8 TaxID=756828 RepID=UPI001C92D2D1
LTGFHKNFVLPIEKHPQQKTIQHLHHLIKPFLLTPTKQHQHLPFNLNKSTFTSFHPTFSLLLLSTIT